MGSMGASGDCCVGTGIGTFYGWALRGDGAVGEGLSGQCIFLRPF